MTRFLAYLRSACRDERGAVMPILMMVSSIMLITGVAFLSISSFDAQGAYKTNAHVQARYFAEEAVRTALWRIENLNPAVWPTWVNFSDSTKSVSYDGTTQTITGVGYYGGVTDTIQTVVSVDTVAVQQQLGHVIVYNEKLILGPQGTLTYPEGNGPKRLKEWRRIRMGHKNVNPREFIRLLDYLGVTITEDMLRIYEGNQTFSGPMDDGIHYVHGNVKLRDGVVLNGMIAATGKIKFKGHVTINAIQVPSTSPDYPAYLPAIAAIRDSDEDEEVEHGDAHANGEIEDEEEEDVHMHDDDAAHHGHDNVDPDEDDGQHIPDPTLDVRINGLIFSTRKAHFRNLTLNGIIISRQVKLGGTYNVTFDGRYMLPPPPNINCMPEVIKPSISFWMEKSK